MFEWILLISQFILLAAVIQLFRLRSREAGAGEEYQSIQFDANSLFNPQAPDPRAQSDAIERLAARLEEIADRIDSELAAKSSPLRTASPEQTDGGSGTAGDARDAPSSSQLAPAEEFVRLQRSGLTIKEIAQRTGRGQQEIELGLGLQRTRKRSAS